MFHVLCEKYSKLCNVIDAHIENNKKCTFIEIK